MIWGMRFVNNPENRLYEIKRDWLVHPGALLLEWFEMNHVPYKCCHLYGILEDDLTLIINGELVIGVEMADKLQAMTQVPARWWIAYEHNFREGVNRDIPWAGTVTRMQQNSGNSTCACTEESDFRGGTLSS